MIRGMTDPTSAAPPIAAAHNGTGPIEDALRIAGRKFQSRLLLGTGGFPSLELLAEAIAHSGSQLVTVALRRIDPAARGSLVAAAEHGRLLHRPRRSPHREARA
jgi:thiazole synthase ThiGH ThiG subunit